MSNPKTTIAGYLLLLGAVATAAGHLLNGNLPDFTSVLAALAGAGLVVAKDGSH
jgi:hypothetical protein